MYAKFAVLIELKFVINLTFNDTHNCARRILDINGKQFDKIFCPQEPDFGILLFILL